MDYEGYASIIVPPACFNRSMCRITRFRIRFHVSA